MQIKLPVTDLKAAQRIESIALQDEDGRHVGQYIFGKGMDELYICWASTEAVSKHTQSAKRSSTASLR